MILAHIEKSTNFNPCSSFFSTYKLQISDCAPKQKQFLSVDRSYIVNCNKSSNPTQNVVTLLYAAYQGVSKKFRLSNKTMAEKLNLSQDYYETLKAEAKKACAEMSPTGQKISLYLKEIFELISKGLTSSEILINILLCQKDYFNKLAGSEFFYNSYEELATEFGMSVSFIKKTIVKFEKLGLITKEKGYLKTLKKHVWHFKVLKQVFFVPLKEIQAQIQMFAFNDNKEIEKYRTQNHPPINKEFIKIDNLKNSYILQEDSFKNITLDESNFLLSGVDDLAETSSKTNYNEYEKAKFNDNYDKSRLTLRQINLPESQKNQLTGMILAMHKQKEIHPALQNQEKWTLLTTAAEFMAKFIANSKNQDFKFAQNIIRQKLKKGSLLEQTESPVQKGKSLDTYKDLLDYAHIIQASGRDCSENFVYGLVGKLSNYSNDNNKKFSTVEAATNYTILALKGERRSDHLIKNPNFRTKQQYQQLKEQISYFEQYKETEDIDDVDYSSRKQQMTRISDCFNEFNNKSDDCLNINLDEIFPLIRTDKSPFQSIVEDLSELCGKETIEPLFLHDDVSVEYNIFKSSITISVSNNLELYEKIQSYEHIAKELANNLKFGIQVKSNLN